MSDLLTVALVSAIVSAFVAYVVTRVAWHFLGERRDR
jgi:hypothetical protein